LVGLPTDPVCLARIEPGHVGPTRRPAHLGVLSLYRDTPEGLRGADLPDAIALRHIASQRAA